MKKSILIICALIGTFGLTAYGFINWKSSQPAEKEVACVKTVNTNFDIVNLMNEATKPDLVYDIEPRFLARISKEDLQNAKTIIDILPEEGTKGLHAFENVEVEFLGTDEPKIEVGESEILTSDQSKLLQLVDYSDNIRISSDCQERKTIAGISQPYDLVYYMSVIPEKEARFKEGYDALVDFLKENSKEKTAIIQKSQLRPGRVIFTVTKDGAIENAHLDSSCGYPSVDEKLVELIAGMSGKWEAAANSEGENVDQELVFFFGLKGC